MAKQQGDPVTPETEETASLSAKEPKPAKKQKSIHAGHRERLKEMFRLCGSDPLKFPDRKLLELILFYGIPQGDVTPVVNNLMSQFGTFDQILDAPYEELLKVPGVGSHTALLLKLFGPVSTRYMLTRRSTNDLIRTLKDAVEYMEPYFMCEHVEKIYVACLSGTGRVLFCGELATGTSSQVCLDPKTIIQFVTRHDAVSVLIAHNHVVGDATPSPMDISTTRKIKTLLNSMNINLFDHLIFSDVGDICSALTGALVRQSVL